MINAICPYCAKCSADSADHVFPQFLGGKATIRACTTCNNTFGHSFEASAFTHFKNLMFVFRRSGMQPPRPMTWRKVPLDDGRLYDIDQDLNAVLSDPIITRDEQGTIVRVEGNPEKVQRIANSLKQKGRTFAGTSSEFQIDLPRFKLQYPIDQDLRRFAIKMSLAVALRLSCNPTISDSCRSYLLSGQYDGTASSPVRIALTELPQLKASRPPLGHLVYVHQNEVDGRCYSVVEFFGAICLYCELGTASGAPSFSVVATHDPVSHHEEFRHTEPIEHPLPPLSVPQVEWEAGVRSCFEAMRLELVDLYGDQAPLTLTPDL